MSLRDAIRDAVDERNKQSGNDAAGEDLDLVSDAQAEIVHGEPLATEDARRKSTKARAPKTQPSAKAGKALTPEPAAQRVQAPAPQVSNTASSKAANTASSKTVNAASGKAVNTADSKAANTASSKAREEAATETTASDEEIETAALTVRVPRSHRIHWLISAKKERTSLTAAITEALNARFGEPTD